MSWNGEERRSGIERRLSERRRTSFYRARTLIVLDGRTWIDATGIDRRDYVRRRDDREKLARLFLRVCRDA